jgi:hypothetical protein
MASPKRLRQNDSARSAQTGRLAVLCPLSPLHLAFALVLAGAVALSVVQLAQPHGNYASAKPALTTVSSHLITVGQPSSPVVFDKSFLSLAPENGRGGEWKRFADGVSQSMPFGVQTIAFGPTRLAELETVNDQSGRKVWRWRLSTSRFKSESRSNGGVPFSAGGVPAGFRILVSGSGIARA